MYVIVALLINLDHVDNPGTQVTQRIAGYFEH